jgi:hypothetical protein
VRKFVILILTLLGSAGLALAQAPAAGNVFIGYSYESVSSSALNLDTSRINLQGWEASLEGKVFPVMGIVADFNGHYGSQNVVTGTPNGPIGANITGHEEDVMFGPRFSVPVGKFRPFVEFEFGIGHMSTNVFGSNNSFATALGGGIDYRIIRPIAWRFQGDYVTTRFFNTSQNNIRLSTGIVFRF